MDLRHLSSSIPPGGGSTSTRPIRHPLHQSATLSRSSAQFACLAASERATFETSRQADKSASPNATNPPAARAGRPKQAVSQARMFLQTIAAARTPSDVARIWREARAPGPNTSISNSVIALMRLSRLPGYNIEEELDAHVALLEELLQSISIRIYSIPPQPLSDLCHAVAKAYSQLPEDLNPPTWWHDMAVDATISTLERSTAGAESAPNHELVLATLEAALTPPASASQALDAARLTRLVASLAKLDPDLGLGLNTIATLDAVIERLVQSDAPAFLTERLAESVAGLLERMNSAGAAVSEEVEAPVPPPVAAAPPPPAAAPAAPVPRAAAPAAPAPPPPAPAAAVAPPPPAAAPAAAVSTSAPEKVASANDEPAVTSVPEAEAVAEPAASSPAQAAVPPPAAASPPPTVDEPWSGPPPPSAEPVSATTMEAAAPTPASTATPASDEDEEIEAQAGSTTSDEEPPAAAATASGDSGMPATGSNQFPVEEASEIFMSSKKAPRRSFPISWEDIDVDNGAGGKGFHQPAGEAPSEASDSLAPYQEHFVMSQLQSLAAQRKTPSAEQLEGCCSAVKQYWEEMHPQDVADCIILLSQMNAGAPLGLPLLDPATAKSGSSAKGKAKGGKKQQAAKADAEAEAESDETIGARYYQMLHTVAPALPSLGHVRRCQLALALSPPSVKQAGSGEGAPSPQRLPPSSFTLAYCASVENWLKDVCMTGSMEAAVPEDVDSAMNELTSVLSFVAKASARGQVLLQPSFLNSCCQAVITLTAQHIDTKEQLPQLASATGSIERLLTLQELLVEGLGAAPSQAWSASLSNVLLPYLSASARKMRFGLNPALASRSLRLLGALRHRPHPRVLHSLLRGLEDEALVGAAPPQQLVHIFWSCAEFQLAPTVAALSAMLPALAEGFPHLEAKDLALLCRSLSQLGVKPSAEWQLKLQERVNECMGEADVQSLSLICQGLLSFGMKPMDKWIDALLKESAFKMDQADAQSLVRLAHFVATCELKIFPTEWVNALQLRSIEVLDTFEPSDMLAVLLRSLAKMHWVPTPQWIVQVLAACSISASELSLASCALVLNALPELGVLKMAEAGDVDLKFFNRLLDRLVRASVLHCDSASSTEIRWLLNAFVLYEQVPFEPNVNAVKRLTRKMKAKEKAEAETEAEEMAAMNAEETQRYISQQLKYTNQPLVASLGDYVSRDWLKSCLNA